MPNLASNLIFTTLFKLSPKIEGFRIGEGLAWAMTPTGVANSYKLLQLDLTNMGLFSFIWLFDLKMNRSGPNFTLIEAL